MSRGPYRGTSRDTSHGPYRFTIPHFHFHPGAGMLEKEDAHLPHRQGSVFYEIDH